MSNLIIKDDNDVVKKYKLYSHDISVNSEEKKLFLELNVGTEVISYEIFADDRQPNILLIENYIREAFKNTFTIREYLVRCYIFIEVGDSEMQFTAHKI